MDIRVTKLEQRITDKQEAVREVQFLIPVEEGLELEGSGKGELAGSE